MAKIEKTKQQIIAENEKMSDQILEDLRSKGGDNMNGEVRANEKLMELINKNTTQFRPNPTYSYNLSNLRICAAALIFPLPR